MSSSFFLDLLKSHLILDYGSGNHRRYIGVSELAAVLEEEQPGLTEVLIGLHALTGCDFTSCFFRKGKVSPFSGWKQIQNMLRPYNPSPQRMWTYLGCYCFCLYGFKTSDIVEARYKAFMRMSDLKEETS